ncbi:MAG: type III-A CRISPR-associated protein Cas10/Csm1, partial [Promethearchaeota archaeon]
MNEKDKSLFSSLTHDIGKLGYRAGERGSHSEIGGRLIENQKAFSSEISSLVNLHHQKEIKNLFQKEGYLPLKILVLSDWLASSERITSEDRGEISKVGLTSIFSKIKIFDHDVINTPSRQVKEFYHLGKALEMEGDCPEIFPNTLSKVQKEIKENFKQNWNKFQEKLAAIERYDNGDDDFELKFEFLYSLLFTHLKLVPSAAYEVEPDISLFDHLKVACAFSAAINEYLEKRYFNEDDKVTFLNDIGVLFEKLYHEGTHYLDEIKGSDKEKLFKSRKLFALVHGDFSGIQRFIHLITSKYASKTLKGRSFYFSLMTELVAEYLVRELKLTKANIIFAGGGHFYLITHYFEQLESYLSEKVKVINEFFLKEFNANLYLAVAHVPLTLENIIFYQKFNPWKRVSEKTNFRKRQRFKDIIFSDDGNLNEKFKEIFGPNENDLQLEERCIICNSYPALQLIDPSDLAREELICEHCKGFIDLTNDLKGACLIKKITNSPRSYKRLFNELQLAVVFENNLNNLNINDIKTWYSINEPGYVNTLGHVLYSTGFPLKNDNSIYNNDELARGAEKRTGYGKLGILKMDVDFLGLIVQKGLGENASFSRISTLSTSLNLFFKGYISKLQERYKESVYIIYSGGDDLFALGAWDELILFAWHTYRDFRRFTAFNSNVTMSAGIVIEDPKFPIMKASALAEEQLDAAKHHEIFTPNKNTKNKIALFGSVLTWDWSLKKEEEYQSVIDD